MLGLSLIFLEAIPIPIAVETSETRYYLSSLGLGVAPVGSERDSFPPTHFILAIFLLGRHSDEGVELPVASLDEGMRTLEVNGRTGQGVDPFHGILTPVPPESHNPRIKF
jgi:hypothetical protein